MVSLQHPILAVMAIAVTAPLLAELPVGVRIPVVVLEVVLGAVVGPHALGWVQTGDPNGGGRWTAAAQMPRSSA